MRGPSRLEGRDGLTRVASAGSDPASGAKSRCSVSTGSTAGRRAVLARGAGGCSARHRLSPGGPPRGSAAKGEGARRGLTCFACGLRCARNRSPPSGPETRGTAHLPLGLAVTLTPGGECTSRDLLCELLNAGLRNRPPCVTAAPRAQRTAARPAGESWHLQAGAPAGNSERGSNVVGGQTTNVRGRGPGAWIRSARPAKAMRKRTPKPTGAPCGRPQAPIGGAPGAVGFAALSPHLGRPRATNPCDMNKRFHAPKI